MWGMHEADASARGGDFTALGFDFGERRIGIAVGQSVTGTARALTTVQSRDARPDWDALGALIAEWRPEHLVVGMPIRSDGSDHVLKTRVTRFCRQLEGRFQIPVATIDERLSSHEAAGHTSVGLDAEAARIILETWFGVYSRGAAFGAVRNLEGKS